MYWINNKNTFYKAQLGDKETKEIFSMYAKIFSFKLKLIVKVETLLFYYNDLLKIGLQFFVPYLNIEIIFN